MRTPLNDGWPYIMSIYHKLRCFLHTHRIHCSGRAVSIQTQRSRECFNMFGCDTTTSSAIYLNAKVHWCRLSYLDTWWIYTHAWNCLKSKFIINIIFLYIHNYTWYFEIWDMCVVCDECYDDVMIQANRDLDWMDRLVWIATTGKLLQDRLWLDRSGLVVVSRLVRLMSCWKGRRVYWQVV